MEKSEIGQQDAAALAAAVKADETAELRKQLNEAEKAKAEAEIAKAKLQGEAKDQKALEDILAGVKSTADQAKNAADAAEKAQAEAEKVRQEMEKTMAEAERARAEARVRAVEAERARTSTTTAAVPVEIQAEPLRVRLQAHGREVIGGAMVLAIIALLVAVYCLFRQPAATQHSQPPSAPKPPAIYEYKDGVLNKIGAGLWKLVGGTAFAEEVKVVKVDEPGVVLVHDKSDELAKAEADLKSLTGQKATLEKELAEAKIETQSLLAKVGTSTSAKQRAEANLKEMAADLQKLEAVLAKAEMAKKRLEAKEALDFNVRYFLDKAYSMPPISTRYYEGLFPGEPTAAGLVRTIHQGVVDCPDGFAPNFWQIGTNVTFTCEPALLPPPLLKDKKKGKEEETSSKYLTCLPWAAVGMAGGGAGNYGYARMADRNYDGRDVAIGVAGGGALAYGLCLFFTEEEKE